MRFIVKVIVIAFALWLTTFLVSGVRVVPYEDTTLATVLTLGLISFIVNGLLLLLVAWISDLMGFGLEIDGFWWGVLAALVLGLISWLIGLILRPVSKD